MILEALKVLLLGMIGIFFVMSLITLSITAIRGIEKKMSDSKKSKELKK